MTKMKDNGGFTLVEAMVTTLIATIIFGASVMILLGGTDSWHVGEAEVELQQELRKGMQAIVRELRQSGASVITGVPVDGSNNTSITFKVSSGTSAGAINWSANDILFNLGGSGNDILQRTEDSVVKPIATGITGLNFTRNTASLVEVTLTGQKTSAKGRTLTDSLNFDVQLRN